MPRRSDGQECALDEAAGGEAVDQAGQAAAAEQQTVGELAHPQRVLRRLGESRSSTS